MSTCQENLWPVPASYKNLHCEETSESMIEVGVKVFDPGNNSNIWV